MWLNVIKLYLYRASTDGVCFALASATTLHPKQDVKDMNEKQELEHYEEGNKWLDEAKQDFDGWFSRLQGEVQTDQQRRVGDFCEQNILRYNSLISQSNYLSHMSHIRLVQCPSGVMSAFCFPFV